MDKNYKIEIGRDSEEVIKMLEEKIYEYNSAAVHKTDGAFFSRIVKDNNGVTVAGIAGWTWANACEITQLWVSDILRGQGIGTKLLEAAEAEARDKECNVVLIKSYSFQAPHFYEKHGYRVDHIQDNFPEGFKYYILSKQIGR